VNVEVNRQEFRLSAGFEPSPGGAELDEEYLAELPPLLAAVRRFKHEYFRAEVVMMAGDREDILELAFDVAYALTQIPDWLRRLNDEGRASLMFGEQGSEQELIAERRGEVVEYSLRPFFTNPDACPRARVPAAQFLGEWTRLTGRVLDTLAALQAGLADDPEFKGLRAALFTATNSGET
jgi:hypothetical protein